MKKINTIKRIAITMLTMVITIGCTVPTFAASTKPSYYPYKSATAKKHAAEMAFKNLEKNSKKATTKNTSKVKTTKNNKSKAKTTKPVKAAVKEKYLNVTEAYSLLNKFRTTKCNQWYWNANNKTKTYTYGLKTLKRDVQLENIAKLRAKEQWASYFVNGRPTHTRPIGKDCRTAYPASAKYYGENLAWGQTSCKQVISDPKWGWAETYEKYVDQGHRRNMLAKSAKRVGIACYEKNGKTCWAMCIGY